MALAYAELDGRLYLVGGDHGADRDPHWVRNLAEEPTVEVEIGRRRCAALAYVVDAAERASIWPRIATRLPSIDLYRDRTRRSIPVVRLQLEERPA